MTTPLSRKPTRLVREFAALDVPLRDRIIHAADHAIKLRDREARPATYSDNGGRVYLKKYFKCCRPIREPSRDYPLSYLSHARTVNHVAHQFGLEEHTSAMRTVIRLMDAGEVLEEVIGRCHALGARESIKMLIKMASSD